MKYEVEAKKVSEIIGNNLPYKVWYFNKEKLTIKLLFGSLEKDLSYNEYKYKLDLEFTDKRIDHFTVDGASIYSFNYEKDAHVLLVFEEEIKISDKKLCDIYLYVGDLYLKEIIDSFSIEREVLMDTVKSISQPLKLKDILHSILVGASKIIKKSSLAYIQLCNSEDYSLVVASAIGFDDDIYGFKPKVGQSIAGAVFLDGKPRYYNSREEMLKDRSNNSLSEENIKILDDIIKTHKLGGIASVPIIYKGDNIGVLTIHKLEEEVEFTEEDVKFLESFASKAAITIENGMLIKKLKETLDYTEKMNDLISKKNKIYKDLTQLSLMNRGLKEISASLSKLLNTDIMLYNKAKNKIEYNNLIKDLEYDEIIKQIVEYEKNDIGLTEGEYRDCFFFPIKNGNVFLGYLISSKEFASSEDNRMLLEESILTITIELMKSYLVEDIIFKRIHEYYNKIINTTDRKEIDEYRQKLDLEKENYFLTSIISIDYHSDLQVLQMENHNLISLLKNEFIGYGLTLFGFHNKVTMLINSNSPINIGIVKEKLNHIIKLESQLNGINLSVGIGSVYNGAENISKTNKEAELALSYIEGKVDKKIIEYDEIGINRLFINHIPGDIDKFLDDTLGELQTEEAKKSSLEETLFAYVDTNKSAIDASEILHIHINTFYNRLKRIEKMLGIDIDNPEDNLKIQLACYLKKNKDKIVF